MLPSFEVHDPDLVMADYSLNNLIKKQRNNIIITTA